MDKKNELNADFSELINVFTKLVNEFFKEDAENKDNTECCKSEKTEEKPCDDCCNKEKCTGCCEDYCEDAPSLDDIYSEDNECCTDDEEDCEGERDVRCSIAEALYNRHYHTWKINKEKHDTSVKDKLMESLSDEVVILFKQILNNTARAVNNMYFDTIPGTKHFDYYITFGGDFEVLENKPYVKVAFDKHNPYSDVCKNLFLKAWNKTEVPANGNTDADLFGAMMGDKLGFVFFDVQENADELVYKFYYFE